MIELRDIHKRFGQVTAVDGVSMSIRRGEFITLLGPSGCGKTTLLRVISGFETPNSGQVELDGEDVTDRPPYRRDVNQVFQSYALFPHMSVQENVAFGLRMKKLPRAEVEQRVGEVLAMVELAGLEGRKPHQLSGGQRQRVALARAIVRRPKVLLLDEPLAALDAKLRHAMQVELKRLQQRLGITFVFVTHDQGEALVMSDRVAVMHEGRVEQLDTPMEVYRRPASVFVARFVGQANLWEAEAIGAGRVRVGDIEIEVPGAAGTGGTRGRVTILVRPELVTIGTDGGFEAEVVEELFTGAVTHLRLMSAGGVEVHAMVAHGGIESQVRRGQRVRCSIGGEGVSVVG